MRPKKMPLIASEIHATPGEFDLLAGYWPFRQREGALDPRHRRHQDDHHLQGVLSGPAPSATRNGSCAEKARTALAAASRARHTRSIVAFAAMQEVGRQ